MLGPIILRQVLKYSRGGILPDLNAKDTCLNSSNESGPNAAAILVTSALLRLAKLGGVKYSALAVSTLGPNGGKPLSGLKPGGALGVVGTDTKRPEAFSNPGGGLLIWGKNRKLIKLN